jgi:4-amino-4-deoxy-L-arabinose transferase-like glycosyltransferase
MEIGQSDSPKNKKIIWLLLAVIVLAAVLRFAWLGSLPEGINNDEALTGYEAYSLLKTGKDHRGNAWPLYFEGFSDRVDNRFSMYIYADIPAVALFGLNEFSTRLPAAIFGVLTVLITYFLSKEIFNNKNVGLFSALLLAVSPWHVMMSRAGHEATMVPFLLSLGLFLFVAGLGRRPGYLVLSAIPLGLSLYGYSITKLLLPLILIGLVFVYRKKFNSIKKYFLSFWVVLLFIIAPFVYLQLTQWARLQGRFYQVSALHDGWRGLLEVVSTYYLYVTFIALVLISLALVVEAFLAMRGLLLALRKRREEHYQLLLFLFFIMPLPVALTDYPLHLLRAVFCLSVIPLFSGYGLYALAQWLRQKKALPQAYSKFLPTALAMLVLLVYALALAPQYEKYPEKVQGGVHHYHNIKTVVGYIEKNSDKFTTVYMTDQINEPYIYLLFYLAYDPGEFQKTKVVRQYRDDDWENVVSFDKFVFCNINKCYNKDDDSLYIGLAEDVLGVPATALINDSGAKTSESDTNPVFKIIDNKSYEE